MTEPTWTSECGTVKLWLGDCLDVMKSWPDGAVDAVVTDPPYSSGGQFRGDRMASTRDKYVQSDSRSTCKSNFTGDNRDQRSFTIWSSIWLSQCLRASRDGSACCIFTDWRQLPSLSDAIQCGGWVWRNIVTWWKRGCRMQRGRFSLSAEYLLYGSNGPLTEGEESPQNVLPIGGVSGDDKEHIAEKPTELMVAILGVTPKGALVADPFMGSGTTGVAAVRLGRSFWGVEIDPGYFEIAKRRIQEELASSAFLDPKPVETQEELFG